MDTSDRSKLIRLAASLPQGSPERVAVLSELKVTASSEIWPDQCKPGRTYKVETGGHTELCIFRGWKVTPGGPIMEWVDAATLMRWEAYMYHGQMSAGSSADKILIFTP